MYGIVSFISTDLWVAFLLQHVPMDFIVGNIQLTISEPAGIIYL